MQMRKIYKKKYSTQLQLSKYTSQKISNHKGAVRYRKFHVVCTVIRQKSEKRSYYIGV